MWDIIQFKVSGSSDCDSGLIKKLCINNDKKLKIRFEYIGRHERLQGQFIISSSDISKDYKEKVYNRIKGIASHLMWC